MATAAAGKGRGNPPHASGPLATATGAGLGTNSRLVRPNQSQVSRLLGECRFDAPADWQGKHVRLEFEAVSRFSKIYVNGQYLGEHYDMESPFSFDVSKTLKYGQSNEVAVWMTGEQTVKDCSSNCDYDCNRTGIWQSGWLASTPRSESTTFS